MTVTCYKTAPNGAVFIDFVIMMNVLNLKVNFNGKTDISIWSRRYLMRCKRSALNIRMLFTFPAFVLE